VKIWEKAKAEAKVKQAGQAKAQANPQEKAVTTALRKGKASNSMH